MAPILPLQGYLANKKHPPPRTLQWDFTKGHVVVLGRGAISYERGTPVAPTAALLPPIVYPVPTGL